MDDSRDTDDAGVPPGLTADGMPALLREVFQQCVDDARTRHDPARDFETFIDELWRQASVAFGLLDDPGAS